MLKLSLIGLSFIASHALAANPCATIENSTAEYQGTVFKGCRLSSVPQGSLYEKNGLKKGDLVAPANSGAHAMELHNEMKSSGAQLQGFKLTEVTKGSIFDKVGLQSGDLIQTCNGRKIESSADAKNISEVLKTSKHVSLEIMRNGQEKKLEADLQSVN